MRPVFRVLVAACAWLALCAAAADPANRLSNPAQEARARNLFREVRCLVCQSESIDESDATLAHDLRQLIRQQIGQGRSDAEIKSFLVSRYGEFVLLTPRASLGNAILWAGPMAVVAGGLLALMLRRRAAGSSEPSPLTAQEEEALEQLNPGERV
jgi:cytochrome c-type biogenesis protein CcmH